MEEPHRQSLIAALQGSIDALRNCPAQWAVAGGWAIDLFLGRVTRAHADVDIAVWRDEQLIIRRCLETDWELSVAVDHKLRPWAAGERLSLPLHEIHAVHRRHPQRRLELLLNDRDAASWIFRRDQSVRRTLDRALPSRDGIAFLAPEIVLLYKSKDPRPSDDADLGAALPVLSDEQRRWLSEAIASQEPHHRWLPL